MKFGFSWPKSSRFARIGLLFGVLLMAAAIVPFLRSWGFGLINLDDYPYVLGHPEIVHWAGFRSIWFFLTSADDCIWMPITRASYALDWILFGEWFGGFHLHSVLIHFLNGLLVWRLLALIFPGKGTYCLIGAILWTVHPLRCESVIMLSSRKDVWSFFWAALSLVLWLRGGGRRTCLALVCFALGAMCKPSVMTLPVLFLLVDACVKREIRPLRYVVPVLMALVLMAFAAWQQGHGGARIAGAGEPMWGRLLGASAAFGIYVRNFVWPVSLAPQCVNVWPELPRFWVPGLAIGVLWGAGLAGIACRLWMRRAVVVAERLEGIPTRVVLREAPGTVFLGAAWFAVAVAPMLGLANFGYHAFADRFTYIPAVGLSIIAVRALIRVGEWLGRSAAVAIAGLALAALGTLAWRQTGYWADDHTLFTHTLEVDGERNYLAHDVLAVWAFEHPHDLEMCVREFEAAIERKIEPSMACYTFYVLALCELGRVDEAMEKIRMFERALVELAGEEKARRILAGKDVFGCVHRWSRLAVLIYTPEFLAQAEKEMEDAADEGGNHPSLWMYLRMRLAERKGDLAAAKRLRERILAMPLSQESIRFSFLAR